MGISIIAWMHGWLASGVSHALTCGIGAYLWDYYFLFFFFFFSWTQHGSLFYLHVAQTKGLGVYTGFSVFVFGLGAGWSRINPMAHGEEIWEGTERQRRPSLYV
jgi:hypothetical protein